MSFNNKSLYRYLFLAVLSHGEAAFYCSHQRERCFLDDSSHSTNGCFYESSSLAAVSSPTRSAASSVVYASKNIEADDDYNVYIDMNQVSDAEALMACRSYLQRKNILGEWTNSKERKRLSAEVMPSIVERKGEAIWQAGPTKAGFFWEDTSELKYYDAKQERALDFDDADGVDSILKKQNEDSNNEKTENNDDSSTSFLDNTGPSASRIRRQAAASRKWSDPEWKDMWYERRWGKKESVEERSAKRKLDRLEKRLRKLQPNLFMARPEVAAMTQKEIAFAIRTYVTGNRKRGASRQKTLQLQRRELNGKVEKDSDSPIPTEAYQSSSIHRSRDGLIAEDKENLEEARRKRSERATRAYQTRIKNEAATKREENPFLYKHRPVSMAATPRDALIRIEAALDSGNVPVVEDCEMMMTITRLKKRKEVLRRILRDCFNLRGKCLPSDMKNPNDSELLFVTQRPIQEIGEFVIYKLKQREIEKQSSS